MLLHLFCQYVYNASYSKNPHIGTFKTTKGVTPEVKSIEFKELKGDSDEKGKKKKERKTEKNRELFICMLMILHYKLFKINYFST